MKQKLLILLSIVLLGTAGYSIYSNLPGQDEMEAQVNSVGAWNPSGGGTYRLSSSIGSTNTTINLASFKEPISNIPYTMSYLNSDIGYGTLAPQSSEYSEFIAFTGITQNSNGTAALTGVTRGLSRTPGTGGCVASSTLKTAHAGQTIFILSNSPCFYSEYMTLRGAETVSGVKTFASTSLPVVATNTTDAQLTANGTNTLATINLLNNTAIAGASNGSETVKGIWEGATASESASSTILGGTGAGLLLQARYATDTPQNCSSVGCIVVSKIGGKIRQSFYDLTELFTFSGGLSSTGTTTISASNINTNPLVINGVSYKYSPTQASASSSAMLNDGNGNISWGFASPYVQVCDIVATSSSNDRMGCTVPSRKFYKVDIGIPTTTGTAPNAIRLQFNEDVGSNYVSSYTVDGGAATKSTTETGFIFLHNTLGNSVYATISCFAATTSLKNCHGVASDVNTIHTGGMTWKASTSTAVTSISFLNSSGNGFGTGSHVRIYASPD